MFFIFSLQSFKNRRQSSLIHFRGLLYDQSRNVVCIPLSASLPDGAFLRTATVTAQYIVMQRVSLGLHAAVELADRFAVVEILQCLPNVRRGILMLHHRQIPFQADQVTLFPATVRLEHLIDMNHHIPIIAQDIMGIGHGRIHQIVALILGKYGRDTRLILEGFHTVQPVLFTLHHMHQQCHQIKLADRRGILQRPGRLLLIPIVIVLHTDAMQQDLTVTGDDDLAGGEAQAGAVPVLNSHITFHRGDNSPVELFQLCLWNIAEMHLSRRNHP